MSSPKVTVIRLLFTFIGLTVFLAGCASSNSYKLPATVSASKAMLVYEPPSSDWCVPKYDLLLLKINSSGPEKWQKPTGRELSFGDQRIFGWKSSKFSKQLIGSALEGSFKIEIPSGTNELTVRFYHHAASGTTDVSPSLRRYWITPGSTTDASVLSFVAESGHIYKIAKDRLSYLQIQDVTDKAHPIEIDFGVTGPEVRRKRTGLR